MDKKKIIAFAIIVTIVVIVIVKNKIDETDNYNLNYSNVAVTVENTEAEEIKKETIKVHVTGEVNNPGLIELTSGDRISDAIAKSGGTTSLANLSKVNLAYILSDGEKIYIPSLNDEEDVQYIVSSTGNSKININTATSEQLQTLSGVGESTALSIIDYREKNGKFSSIEDIKNVSGIGDSKFEKIKDSICVK